VSFDIQDLNRITTEHFDVYFHLWQDGMANWFRKFEKWRREEDPLWHKVAHRKCKPAPTKRVSFAPQLVQNSRINKSSPQELQSRIMLGDFSCEVLPLEDTLQCPASVPFQIRISNQATQTQCQLS
jgi:hypothetical protein